MVVRHVPILLIFGLAACQSNLSTDLGREDDDAVSSEASAEPSGDDETLPEPAGLPADDDDGSPPASEAGAPLPPVLVDSNPADGDTGVDLKPKFVFVFDRGISAGTGKFVLLDSVTGATVEQTRFDSSSVSINARRAVVSIDVTLEPSTSYSFMLEPGVVVGNDGSPFVGIEAEDAIGFSTRASSDPFLVATVPENLATGVQPDSDITLEFDQDMVAGDGELVVWELERGAVAQSVSLNDEALVSFEGPFVTVELPASLAAGLGYYVTIDRGALSSVLGAEYVGFDDELTFSFETADAEVDTPPGLVSTVPADDATEVDLAASLVFTFSDEIAAGSGEIRIVSSDGDSFEAVDVRSSAVTIASSSLTVDPTLSFEPSTGYYVEFDAGTVVGPSGAPCAALLGPTAFSFSTAAEPSVPLVLQATNPADDAVGVAPDALLTLTFDREVRAGAGFIRVFQADDQSQLVGIEVTDAAVVFEGATVTIDVGVPLATGREYYVLVGAGAFEDQEGAIFAGISDPTLWSFVTTESFDVVGKSPEPGATLVDPAADLSLTFSADVVVGVGNVEIRTAGGQTLETVPIGDPRVFVDANVVTIDLDSLLTGDTEYVVVVDATALSPAAEGEFQGISETDGWSFTTVALDGPGGVEDGLVLWLDAEYGESRKVATGLRLWADRSGQHNDLCQADDAAQPAIAEGVLSENDAIRFDGVDDSMSAPTAFDLSSFEGFVVWQSDEDPGSSKRSILINGKNFEVNHGHAAAARNALSVCVGSACVNNQGWFDVRFVPPPVAETAYLWDFGFDAVTTSTFARSQGSAPVVNTGPTASPTEPLNPFSVGGDPLTCEDLDGCHFAGDVGEVLLFSRTLSRDERVAVTAYLRDKWGTPEPICDIDQTLGPNGSCYALTTTALPHADARAACRALGSGWDLATVRSAEDHAFAQGLLSEDTWIGGSDSEAEGTWRWLLDTLEFWSGGTTGSEANGAYSAWGASEPSAASGADCLRYVSPAFFWADAACTTELPSLCEGPAN
jgi:methionine-rich copper-binding protein CopC